MTRPKLVVFDVDGTLVDSQADILAAIEACFDVAGRPVPGRRTALSIVGLSLDEAMSVLVPDADEAERRRMVEAYRDSYMARRATAGAAYSPLYPGARETLEALAGRDDLLLGIATGKSRRGLEKLIEAHNLEGLFVTRQVCDDHPSKPHPSMLLAAVAEAGVAPDEAAMVGDTSYDMDMAASAGVPGIGVSWGYHPVSALSAARKVVGDFSEIPRVLDSIWGEIR